MSLASHYATSKCAISFELFPPKTDAGMAALCDNIRRLMEDISRRPTKGWDWKSSFTELDRELDPDKLS